MESWVTIKKGKQVSKVPYQSFKDVFEKDGFVIVDDGLDTSPTFSVSVGDTYENNAKQNNNVEGVENEPTVDNDTKQEVDIKDERKPNSNSKRASGSRHKK